MRELDQYDSVASKIHDLANAVVADLTTQGLKMGSEHQPKSLKTVIDTLERVIVWKMLDHTQGNQSLTASILGVARGTVINTMKRGE